MKENSHSQSYSPRRERILPFIPKTPRQIKRIHEVPSSILAMLDWEDMKQEKSKWYTPRKSCCGPRTPIPKTPVSGQLVHKHRTMAGPCSRWTINKRHLSSTSKTTLKIPFLIRLDDERRIKKAANSDDNCFSSDCSKSDTYGELLFDDDSFSSWTMMDSIDYNARHMKRRNSSATGDIAQQDSSNIDVPLEIYTAEVASSPTDCSDVSEHDDDVDLLQTFQNFGLTSKHFESQNKTGANVCIQNFSSSLAHVETNPAA